MLSMLDRIRMELMTIDRFDHIVLTVKDLDATCRFYTQVLGMRLVEGSGRRALHFGQSKINLHEVGHEFSPKADHPTPGSADICLVSQDGSERILAQLRNFDVPVIEGPVERTGALGDMRSVYFRDPDQNLIEVSTY